MTHGSHELALCIINDSGEGSTPYYGTTYQTRVRMGQESIRRSNAKAWLTVALVGAERYNQEFGAPGEHYHNIFPPSDILYAAAKLAEYYANHAAECEAHATS